MLFKTNTMEEIRNHLETKVEYTTKEDEDIYYHWLNTKKELERMTNEFKSLDNSLVKAKSDLDYYRKLLKELHLSGDTLGHIFFGQELQRQEQVLKTYNRLKNKHKDKSKEWWLASVGIDLDLL